MMRIVASGICYGSRVTDANQQPGGKNGMRSRTGAAAYVGRLGALAVALGVCAAVTGGQGVAWAEGSDSGSSPGATSSAESASSPESSATDTAPADPGPADTISPTGDTATSSV